MTKDGDPREPWLEPATEERGGSTRQCGGRKKKRAIFQTNWIPGASNAENLVECDDKEKLGGGDRGSNGGKRNSRG